jgi:hypothetical protein
MAVIGECIFIQHNNLSEWIHFYEQFSYLSAVRRSKRCFFLIVCRNKRDENMKYFRRRAIDIDNRSAVIRIKNSGNFSR